MVNAFDGQKGVAAALPHLQVGARLTSFQHTWTDSFTNQFVKEIVQVGHTLPFLRHPPPFSGIIPTPTKGKLGPALRQELEQLLSKRAIEELGPDQQQAGFYSTFFLVEKKTGEFRPIINLSRLNLFLKVEHFHMESLRSVITMTQIGDWMASLDLKDAYFHVPIRESHRKFLRFSMDNRCFQYRALPFGLSTAPRVFTKVLAPVMAKLRFKGVTLHPYLDDILIRAQSRELLVRDLDMVVTELKNHGFIINLDKSQLTPSQDIVFLGARFQTCLNQVSLSDQRKLSLRSMASKFQQGRRFTARQWLALVGKLVSTKGLVRNAPLFYRPIQWFMADHYKPHLQSLQSLIQVTPQVFEHIKWWTIPSNLDQSLPLSLSQHSDVITADAQPHFHGPRSLGGTSTQLAHQQPRDAGGDSDVASLCEQTVGSSSSGQIRQHDSLQLSQQSGRNAVGFPLPTDSQVMEMGIGPSLGVEGSLSPRGSQPASRRIVQTEKDASPSGERAGRQGVEFERSSSGGNFSPVRSPSGGSVCDKVQQEAPSVCVAGTRRRRVRSRRNVNFLGSPLRVRFSPSCAVAEDTRQDKEGEGDHPIDSSQMAPEGMVLRSSAAINRDTVGVTSTTGSPFAERQVSSKSAIPEAHGLETKRQQLLDQGLSEKSADIVMAAKSESTRTVYSKQWDSFCDWCSQSGFNPLQANVNQIVSFLEHLFYEDRKPATIKTYCSAISFFRGRIEGMTLLSIPIVKNWLQGISRLRPTTKVLCPSWDLALVLNALMEAPYEPAQSATLTAWTHKTVFLIAVTSAARVSEIQALDCRPHLSIIRRNTAILRTDPMFIPKVNSQHNRDREIFLEGFFPSPKTRQERHWHTVCPVRALKYYLEKTKDLRKPDCNRIFVATSGRSVGSSVKTCTISSWIRHTIQNAYEHMGRDPPAVRAHSVRGMATSLALSKGICVQDICRAATWSSEHVFVKHYKLDVLPANAASLSNAVLTSGIQK